MDMLKAIFFFGIVVMWYVFPFYDWKRSKRCKYFCSLS